MATGWLAKYQSNHATEAKKRWIKALALAGIPEIEVGSFVPARIFPQFADMMESLSMQELLKASKWLF